MDQVAQNAELQKFYWVMGTLIVMNFGTIISIFVAAAKALWWVSKLDSRVETNRKDINEAHKMIRKIKSGD